MAAAILRLNADSLFATVQILAVNKFSRTDGFERRRMIDVGQSKRSAPPFKPQRSECSNGL